LDENLLIKSMMSCLNKKIDFKFKESYNVKKSLK
jgi:hypothetical protein